MSARWLLPVFVLFLGYSGLAATSFGQELNRKHQGWRGTVACESVVIYSQMSSSSRVVKQLKKGDVVSIDLEFISAAGAWSSVAELGRRQRLGYAQSECLERQQSEPPTLWQIESRVIPVLTNPTQPADTRSERQASKEEIAEEVDKIVTSRLKSFLSTNNTVEPEREQRPQVFIDNQIGFLPFFPSAGFIDRGFHFSPKRFGPSFTVAPNRLTHISPVAHSGTRVCVRGR